MWPLGESMEENRALHQLGQGLVFPDAQTSSSFETGGFRSTARILSPLLIA